SPAAVAADEAHADIDEFSHHCIEILEGGGSVDECQEAPSPIMPETAEIVWGGLAFVLLFLLMWMFAFPAIRKGLDGRAERIRADLEAAETAKADATGVLADYQSQLADARAEAARIIEEARSTADSMRRDLAAKAEADIAEMR